MAFDELQSVKEMKIEQHIFWRTGKLLEVANLAITWYKRHLVIKCHPDLKFLITLDYAVPQTERNKELSWLETNTYILAI
jgi:hypothetical protein